MDIAKKIRKLRESVSENRSEFSEHIGVPVRTIEDWESGRRTPPEYVPRLIAYQLEYEKLAEKQKSSKGAVKKQKKCYIYTRVSTEMQEDGYSLKEQMDKLREYAGYNDMTVADEFWDKEKSGKKAKGRPEFVHMMEKIKNGEDGVEYVVVSELSRFGINATDVLNSLRVMQDNDVNLICAEDGIDSSKDNGKLMISILSAVAEIESESAYTPDYSRGRKRARRVAASYHTDASLKTGVHRMVEDTAEHGE